MSENTLTGEELHRAAMQNKVPFSVELGTHVFKRYIALLYRLCVVEQNNYDLLVGPGDSGAVMVYFAELFYKAVGITKPPRLILPIQRFKDVRNDKSGKYDNSVLLPLAEGRIPAQLSKILFLDDEIAQANSASECASLIVGGLTEAQKTHRIVFTIIADNHGFEWHYDIPPIAIQYYSFSRRNKGKNNAALRFLSEEQQVILNKFTEPHLDEWDKEDGCTKKMNLLFNGMVKAPSNSGDEIPKFKYVPVEQFTSENINFLKFRSKIEDQVVDLIHEAISEYKEGKIIPTF